MRWKPASGSPAPPCTSRTPGSTPGRSSPRRRSSWRATTTKTSCTNGSRPSNAGCWWKRSSDSAAVAAPWTDERGHFVSTDLGRRPVRRALIGVSDKAGLLDLATGLHAAGVEIVSTGGTAKAIADAGVPVTPVEDVTGSPESLDGRVKTLHPNVHAGLLADQGNPDHVEQLRKLDIAAFDLLVVNLYPFEQTVASGASPEDCVENIDIGGPAMVRGAAKNHGSVAVVVDPSRYAWVLEKVSGGGFELADRKRLAAQAYAHTASYDIAVASWFSNVYAPADDSGFPDFSG